MLVLSGLVVIVAGFALGLNPFAVVVAAALVTALAAGMTPVAAVAALGHGFAASRYVSVIWLVLPVIGLLEQNGLQEQARRLVARIGAATPGRLMIAYLLLRQVSAALGLIAVGGQAQTVRPLLVPMVEAAAERQRPLDHARRQRLRAMAAATDTIGVFYGEDIFLAMSSILLIKGFLDANGITAAPFAISIWAIPTAVAASLVHGTRLWRIDRE